MIRLRRTKRPSFAAPRTRVEEASLRAVARSLGATVVPFLDFPENFVANPAPDRRLYDTRTLESFLTPKDQFFTTQHLGHPVLDPATFTLNVGGMVLPMLVGVLTVPGLLQRLGQ